MSNINTRSDRFVGQEAYNKIHDSFTAAKSMSQLQKAVEAAIPLMSAARIDKEHQAQLERYGKQRFTQIENELRHLGYIVKSNRKN